MTSTISTETTPKSNMGKKILFFLFMVVLLIIGGTILVFNYTYSEGNRAGVVVKFSKKGYIFKTYEGELNMGGMNTITNTAQANQIWTFSVVEPAIAEQMMKLEGKRVSLHYREKVKALPWRGDTKFFVDGVQVIQ